MSKHYLLDIYQTDPSHGRLKELCIPDGGVTYIDGSYVVRVPDDVIISDTVNTASDLLTEKYSGLLANSAFFTHIVYDPLFDETGIDLASSACVTTGVRGVCSLFTSSFWSTPGYPTPTLQTNMIGIAPFPPATQCIVYFEVFKYGGWDYCGAIPGSHAYRRYYQEVDENALFACEVSFNNGATWTVAISGELTNIALADQGTQLIVRFTRGWSNERLYLGSWAVLY